MFAAQGIRSATAPDLCATTASYVDSLADTQVCLMVNNRTHVKSVPPPTSNQTHRGARKHNKVLLVLMTVTKHMAQFKPY